MRYDIIREQTITYAEVINTVTLSNEVEYDAFAEQARAQGYTLRRVE